MVFLRLNSYIFSSDGGENRCLRTESKIEGVPMDVVVMAMMEFLCRRRDVGGGKKSGKAGGKWWWCCSLVSAADGRGIVM